MIIFGTGKSLIHTGEPTFNCAHCGSIQSVGLRFFVHYFHIFWIPMFSYKVKTLSYCTHCRQMLEKRGMTAEQSQHILQEKPRVPLKYFSGLLLGAVLILFIIVAIVNENRQTDKYLQQPQVGDVYGMKQSNGYYTLYLVSQMKGDSLGFRINNYEVPSSSKLSVIRRDHAADYGKSVVFVSKEELEKLMEEKYIVNIRRD
ncbi:zinc-ribbon domain-containing protein [Olivibacter sp. CPCC 100613]|uniref:hypothetical protein n=1 Tax=Olivibacter sp. CPCC 100613 TaxID=3079931 RepID=UPI002FF772E7